MFGFGLKKGTAEAVRRGMRASLTSAYLHFDEIDQLGLNMDASSFLLTESYAHNLFVLKEVFTTNCQEKWATFAFFKGAVLDGMTEFEKMDEGPDVSKLAPILFNRLSVFQTMSSEDRSEHKHFIDSSELVKKQDKNAEISTVVNMLAISTKKYEGDMIPMFI